VKLEEKYLNEAAKLQQPTKFEGNRQVGWKSPSNIALVKYWGKREVQLPQNPSLSFSLKNSFTETSVEYSIKKGPVSKLEFVFEGNEQPDFEKRLRKYLDIIYPYMPFLKALDMHIESVNSFPHSSGIASSASAMSALALCFVSMEKELFGSELSKDEFYQKASFVARLGSGSAARSVFGSFVIWGESESVEDSSDETGIPVEFHLQNGSLQLADAILITDSSRKKVASSAGHGQMKGHPWAETRYRQAREHLIELVNAIQQKNDEQFIRIVENEALSLHAMMMTSENGFTLLNENTWKIIELIREFREREHLFMAFTLDAGPNVHLIYRQKDKPAIKSWIQKELTKYCENGYWIDDEIGQGPKELN